MVRKQGTRLRIEGRRRREPPQGFHVGGVGEGRGVVLEPGVEHFSRGVKHNGSDDARLTMRTRADRRAREIIRPLRISFFFFLFFFFFFVFSSISFF